MDEEADISIENTHTQCQKEKTTTVGSQPNNNSGTELSQEMRRR